MCACVSVCLSISPSSSVTVSTLDVCICLSVPDSVSVCLNLFTPPHPSPPPFLSVSHSDCPSFSPRRLSDFRLPPVDRNSFQDEIAHVARHLQGLQVVSTLIFFVLVYSCSIRTIPDRSTTHRLHHPEHQHIFKTFFVCF